MKKFLLLSLVMVLGVVVAGCGSQQQKQDQTPTDKQDQSRQEDQAQKSQDKTGEEDGEDKTSQTSLISILDRGSDLDSLSYDVIMDTPQEESREMNIWMKGDKMRTETQISMQGQERKGVYILDKGEQEAYMYLPSQNRAIKTDFSKAKEQAGTSPQEQRSEIKNKKPDRVGQETINGKECVVVEYTNDEGKTTKAWIWKEYGLPIKTVSQTNQGEIITEIKNIDFSDIPDSKMELPEGAQVMDIPTGMMP